MRSENKISVAISLLSVVLTCFTACQNNSKTTGKTPVKHTVEISAMKFVPDTIMVHPGDTVTFINKDLVAHNATQLPDSAWRSPNLQEGERWSFVPAKSDSFFCSIHVVMKGYIMMMR
ncbi:MAG TPA: plastocyanin/azurin family copper-binding protein [Edaphocola sp.]|nr:plastocyanin/azurin family copper-binding protein [Edaphocola sp.]